MKIERIKVGLLECNCYILTKNNQSLIIDPGDEVDKIVETVGNNQVIGILITHYHFDHIGALNEIKRKYNVKVYDKTNLKEYNKIGDFVFKVIDTKGHTEDSITYYFEEEKIMFTGDFLFKGTIGRTDLDGGNMSYMLDSIKKIKHYSKDICIYPGHGEETTLEEEILNNVYLKKG